MRSARLRIAMRYRRISIASFRAIYLKTGEFRALEALFYIAIFYFLLIKTQRDLKIITFRCKTYTYILWHNLYEKYNNKRNNFR